LRTLIKLHDKFFKPYIKEEEILSAIDKMAKEIAADYKDETPLFVGVLNGAYIFLADLMRYVTIPCEVDFLKLSSYGDEKVSSGQVRQLKEIDANLKDRHVILVEDIVDTGLSMKYLVEKVGRMKPASLSVITMLHKSEATHHDVQIDYVGFKIPDLFVLGYGLDYAQEGRNLAQIYILQEKKKSEKKTKS